MRNRRSFFARFELRHKRSQIQQLFSPAKDKYWRKGKSRFVEIFSKYYASPGDFSNEDLAVLYRVYNGAYKVDFKNNFCYFSISLTLSFSFFFFGKRERINIHFSRHFVQRWKLKLTKIWNVSSKDSFEKSNESCRRIVHKI